jgi:hypothetical protein
MHREEGVKLPYMHREEEDDMIPYIKTLKIVPKNY